MKTRATKRIAPAVILAWMLAPAPVPAQDTAFTYQGELLQAGMPADGLFDFQVSLYDFPSGGTPIASDEVFVNEHVSLGVFHLNLDFGSAILTAPELWLEVRVRAAGQPVFTLLEPRWRIMPAPRAGLAHVADLDAVDSAAIVPESVLGADIAPDAVGANELAFGAVQNHHIQDGAISTPKIQAGAVTASRLAPNSVGADEIAFAAVTAGKVGTGAVDTSELADESVGNEELAVNAVNQDEIAPGAVGVGMITNDAVGTTQLANGAVGMSDINAGEIQRRVNGFCPPGQAIRTININGTAGCENDSRGIHGLGSPIFSAEVSSFGTGSTIEVLATTDNTICHLTKTVFRNIDNASEVGRCRVFVSAGNWILEAFVTDGRDGNALCNAACQSILVEP